MNNLDINIRKYHSHTIVRDSQKMTKQLDKTTAMIFNLVSYVVDIRSSCFVPVVICVR